ncbi:MAG: glucosamine/fructose-6-phosphate aminotransferase, isomerizing [Acidimicrobiaceae bacterium]|nr:glucosamine/fructose-6-phosphate aminotransferase, isomerizing [Acidimicrobiaceae bacterium]
MCGIIGVTGTPDACEVLLAGLELLEYRGYDSAGIVVADPEAGTLWRARAAERAGSIQRLRDRLDEVPATPGAGVGHTRWATHGPPTDANAHPHIDCTGRVAIVHNGIIENYRDLAARLDATGHKRTSATDTEVLAHLIEDEVEAGASLGEAVRRCLRAVRGDFAIAAVHAAEPDLLVAARRTSPLIVGKTETVGVVASDVAAALATTRELYALDDDQVAEVRPGAIVVYDLDGVRVEPTRIEVAWGVRRAMKGGYPDFMSKEIHEQPQAVRDTLLGRIGSDGSTEIEELALSDEELRAVRRLVFVACGSSYHAGLVARQAIERWAGVAAEAEVASEFRYRQPVLDDGTLVVVISQSGETVDTLHAMREARRRGARVVALTNVVDSVMSREADGVLYTRAGPEIGVASTKCHLAQLAMLETFALHLARVRGALAGDELAGIAGALLSLPDALQATLARADEFAAVAERFAEVEDFYFLGRRTGFPVALEGALKLKELAYVRAEAYPAGEMKHGPISLIEPGAVVVVIATRSSLWEKVMGNVEEMRARGASVVAVADEGDDETAGLVDAVLEVPSVIELCSPVVNVVPLQSFAYTVARARGNDVDRPRNLAKVVTVE